MKILCICHANICRSFLAQEFFKQLLPGATVFSRGLYADPTYVVPDKVKHSLSSHGIAFTGHTSTPLSPSDLQQADLIFCMEQAHEEYLLDRYPQYTDKLWLLNDFAFDKTQDLPDPISLEGRAFEKQTAALYESCQAASRQIKQKFLSYSEAHP